MTEVSTAKAHGYSCSHTSLHLFLKTNAVYFWHVSELPYVWPHTTVHWHVIFYSMVQWSSMYNGVMGYFLLRVHSWTICSSSEDFLCTECSIINSHYTNWTASRLRRVNMTVFNKNHTRTTETLTLHVQRITSTMDVSVSDILQKKLCTPNVSDTENRHPLLT